MSSLIAAGNESLELLKNDIDRRIAAVGVIGMGYVGLPLALLFGSEGFRVTELDIDAQKVTTLNSGHSYIFRIAPEEIRVAKKTGLPCDHRLFGDPADGCDRHLRADAAERISRA